MGPGYHQIIQVMEDHELVLKPMVLGIHNFKKPPYKSIIFN